MKRFLQFRLAALLILVTAACLALAAWQAVVAPWRNQRAAIEAMGDFDGEMEITVADASWAGWLIGDEDHVVVESLEIYEPEFGDEQLKHLRRFWRLKHLTLLNTSVTGEGLANLRSLRNLETLRIYSTPIGDKGLQHIGEIESLKSLTLWQIGCTDQGLAPLAKLHNLEQFTAPETTTRKGLAHIAGLPRLKEVVLSDTQIVADDLAVLHSLPLTTLPELNDFNTYDDLDIVLGFRQLEELDLYRSIDGLRLTDDDLARVAGLKRLKKLQFESDNVTTRGLKKLAALPDLTELGAFSTSFRREELEIIATDFRIESFSLTLTSTQLTPEDLTVLFKSPALKRLVFFGQWYDDEEIRITEALFAYLERCEINSLTNWTTNNDDVVVSCESSLFSGLCNLAPLARHTRLNTIQLNCVSGGECQTPRPFQPLAELKQLETLAISQGAAPVEAYRDLLDIPSIRRVEFEQCDIDDEKLKFIVQLPNLEHLRLLDSEITDDGFALLSQAPNLKSVQINSPHLTNACLATAKKMPKLKTFNLQRRGGYERLDAAAMIRLKAELPEVHVELVDGDFEYSYYGPPAKVTGVVINSRRFKAFDELRLLPHLEKVYFTGPRTGETFTIPDDEVMASIARVPKLTKLWVSYPFEPDAFSHLKDMPNLEQLMINDRSAAGALPHIGSLKQLYLIELGSEGDEPFTISANDLEQFGDQPKLAELYLEGVIVNDNCLEVISRWKTLATIAMRHSTFTETGVRHLQSLPNLRRLYLNNCVAPVEAMEAFRQANPECQIEAPAISGW